MPMHNEMLAMVSEVYIYFIDKIPLHNKMLAMVSDMPIIFNNIFAFFDYIFIFTQIIQKYWFYLDDIYCKNIL